MTIHLTWRQWLAILLVCGLLASGTSFLVARAVVTNQSRAELIAPMPLIDIGQRPTARLSEQLITSIVSADATTIHVDGQWLLESPVPNDDLAYRLLDPPVGVRALINGGPAGFTCQWVGLGQAGATESTSFVPSGRELSSISSGGVSMRCAIPDDVRVVAGMRGVMALQIGESVNAQSLPITAVVGTADQGQVLVVHPDGSTEVRAVQLGVSDTFNIEITGGLNSAEAVLQHPTQADFANAGDE